MRLLPRESRHEAAGAGRRGRGRRSGSGSRGRQSRWRLYDEAGRLLAPQRVAKAVDFVL